MPLFRVYVTRDASVTYSALIEAPSIEDVEARCTRTGLSEDNLGEVEWEVDSTISYDQVEKYRITEDVIKQVAGMPMLDEVTLKEWSL